MNQHTGQAISLLKKLIATPSFPKEEDQTAGLIQEFLNEHGIPSRRHINNVWAVNKHFNENKPTILLNSHHDTVKPNSGYTRDPFTPAVEDGLLYGLGSNDAGGPLVSLIAAFIHCYEKENPDYNLILAATGEEEIAGKGGIISILDKIGPVDAAIVGEPTQMQMAIAEKGLLVLDCTAKGVSGHAARDEGENAIYKAMRDIEWFRTYNFEKQSDLLGPVKMTATIIRAGDQHNVVPDTCTFTIDLRTTDAYSNEEVLELVRSQVESDVKPRSTRLNPSFISREHPIVKAGVKLGRETYGSPTLSDQASIQAPSLKMGPGDSARSHTPDEYIALKEIEEGIDLYIKLLTQLM